MEGSAVCDPPPPPPPPHLHPFVTAACGETDNREGIPASHVCGLEIPTFIQLFPHLFFGFNSSPLILIPGEIVGQFFITLGNAVKIKMLSFSTSVKKSQTERNLLTHAIAYSCHRPLCTLHLSGLFSLNGVFPISRKEAGRSFPNVQLFHVIERKVPLENLQLRDVMRSCFGISQPKLGV